MQEPQSSRPESYARRFEAAQDEFIRLVESLSDEEWRRVGANYPQRLNDEDEHRSVGVIAHHVAVNSPWIISRIRLMLERRPLPSVDIATSNAAHATEHAGVSRDEVLRVLRQQEPEIAAEIRAIPDAELDVMRDTPVGPMSVAQRLDRVLIGHMKVHQGSIETAVGRSGSD